MKEILKLPELWQTLSAETRPIVLYGMGDGADKILKVCNQKGIPLGGVFASETFVRPKQFHQWALSSLSQLEQSLGDLVVLVAFGTSRPEVLEQIQQIAARHTLYVPDVPVAGDHLFDQDFFQAHLADFSDILPLWADSHSRLLYREILSFKRTGIPSYLTRTTPRREQLGLLSLGSEEIFVDAGAYKGDTIQEFLELTGGRYQKIYALEPDEKNYQKLRAATQHLPRVELLGAAAWQGEDTLYFQPRSGRSGRVEQGSPNTRGVAVDQLVNNHTASYLKFDVEGAEEQALLGSRQTIAHSHPKLLVSAYHRPEDLYSLPNLIKTLDPNYQLYLRRSPGLPAWDLNLFAL